jgi:hypothetical protein
VALAHSGRCLDEEDARRARIVLRLRERIAELGEEPRLLWARREAFGEVR